MELNLSLQDLLNLTLVWTLLNLLAANQVQELGCQDEVTLNSLRSNKNKSQSPSPWSLTSNQLSVSVRSAAVGGDQGSARTQ